MEQEILHVHAILKSSRANGPGMRAVVWAQGCSLDCSACFNPRLKLYGGGAAIPVKDLVERLLAVKSIEGITISGGEPTEQAPALVALLTSVKRRSQLSVVLFSGRTLSQIRRLPFGPQILSCLDVLIDGPYEREKANPPGLWPSSSNQKIHFLSSRYTTDDFRNIPNREVIITEDGDVMETGLGVVLADQ